MASSGLSQHLVSIQLENGSPDVVARRAELGNLIRSISHAEIRYLKDQLATITFHKDICGSLPVELLLAISLYLDLEDLARILGVSRQWRDKFSCSEISLSIAKRYFRTVWSTFYESADPERQLGDSQMLSQWLPQALSRRIRRHRGLYSSRFVRLYNQQPGHSSDPYGHYGQYRNGRLAYNRDDRTVVIENIRAGTTTYMVEENRMKMRTWKLTDQFLLVRKVNPHMMLAKPLDALGENVETTAIRLPSLIHTESALEDQVAITIDAGVMIWTIGAGLKLLNTYPRPPQLSEYKVISFPKVIFHPQNKHHLFMATYGHIGPRQRLTPAITHVVIQEHKDDKLVAFHHYELPPLLGAHGGDLTVKEIEDGCIAFLLAHQSPYLPSPNRLFMAVKFDVYTKSFTTTSYHLPDSIIRSTWDAFIWCGQLLFPIPPHQLSHHDGEEFELVVGRDACDEIHKPGMLRSLSAVDDSSGKPNEKYTWIGGYYPLDQSRGGSLSGDDDSVVLFARHGFVVWNFD